jgi:DUF1365 family protein
VKNKLYSGLYVGMMRHRRYSPKAHSFQYNVAFFYIDLSEVEKVFRIPFLFGQSRLGLVSFYRPDYLSETSVRELVQERLGEKHIGPIRLLTQPRYLGFCFNPVSFYYCFDPSGERVQYIVAEITNTPWNERYSYVLRCDDSGRVKRSDFEKIFHVSPFMPMEMRYLWDFGVPGHSIGIRMENIDPQTGAKIFDATVGIKRKEITFANVATTLIQFPLLTIKNFVAIYFQALLLKIKGVPFFSHPHGTTIQEKKI